MVFIVILRCRNSFRPILGAIVYVFLVSFKLPRLVKYHSGRDCDSEILFLPDGIMGTLQKKLHFEIFSQKRFSEQKKRKIKDAANAA